MLVITGEIIVTIKQNKVRNLLTKFYSNHLVPVVIYYYLLLSCRRKY